jgi:phospholipid transport system substrate-binding protein
MKTARVQLTFFSILFSFIVSLAVAVPCYAAEGGAKPDSGNLSSQFVRKLGDTALMSLTAKNVNRATREKRVREILQDNFDVGAIGRFALGTYWREASEKQRKEYMALFEDMIVQTYTTRFEDYSGQTLKVDGSKAVGQDSLVTSRVVQKDGPPVGLEWRIRDQGGSLRVVDVIVEGVSMSITQRSDFAAVIQHGGGKVEALLASLRERRKAAANPSHKG